jgi:hypothetical protein
MSSTRSASSSSSSSSRGDKARKVTARADELDSYMERLYDEDVESKLEGASMILQLAEFAGNIEALVQNEALMVRWLWMNGRPSKSAEPNSHS